MDLNESVNGAAYKRVSLLQMSSDGTETLFKSVAGAARYIAESLNLSLNHVKSDLSEKVRKLGKTVGTEFTYKSFSWRIVDHDKVNVKKCSKLQCIAYNLDGKRCRSTVNLYERLL